jgi:hypothetical protein
VINDGYEYDFTAMFAATFPDYSKADDWNRNSVAPAVRLLSNLQYAAELARAIVAQF